MSIKTVIPIVNAPKCPAYSNVDVQELAEKGCQYCTWGRLSIGRLEQGVAALISKWYRKKGDFSIQVHLVIPPELILKIMSIFREDSLTENFVTRLIDKVWVDTNIECKWPNCPWYLFVSSDFITGDEVDVEGMYYSQGTAP